MGPRQGGLHETAPGCTTHPCKPREGETEEFDVCHSDPELESLKDSFGDIRYERVHDVLLPEIGGQKYYHWLTARMRHYMVHLIRNEGYKQRYYNPGKGKEILGHHVARYYFGVEICHMLRGFPSVDETRLIRESLFEIGLCSESMPKAAMQDMARCIHFTDDWDIEEDLEWDSVYPEKKRESPKRPSII